MQTALPLNFDPLPRLNSTAPVERKHALQAKARAILAALRQGPVSNTDMLRIGGSRYGARLGEVRAYLRWYYGMGKDWQPILCDEDKGTGYAVYRLVIR